ncbi:MAG: hypothetical protein LQ352_006499 [Teloschistes flavicans]|nr:MAG: hypothetical protein LQ352_006499 [Teloschistes flavicans]
MTTDLTPTELTYRPDLRIHIAQAFFGFTVPFTERIYALKQYFIYFSDELKLLRTGISRESWQTKDLAIHNCEDLFHVVDILRTSKGHRRPEIRQKLLSRFGTTNDLAINRSLNLALRLWLMINVQEPAFAGLRHGATSVEWDDERPLLVFVESLFPPSRWSPTAQSSRFAPHFTAAFMQRVCGLNIEWTTSLHDHLRLDSVRKALKASFAGTSSARDNPLLGSAVSLLGQQDDHPSCERKARFPRARALRGHQESHLVGF